MLIWSLSKCLVDQSDCSVGTVGCVIKVYSSRLLFVPVVSVSARDLCCSLLMQFVFVCQMLPWLSRLFPCWHTFFFFLFFFLLFRLGLFGLFWSAAGWLTSLLIGSFMADRCCSLASGQLWPVSARVFVTAVLLLLTSSMMCLHFSVYIGVGPTAVTCCRLVIQSTVGHKKQHPHRTL